MRYFLELSYKGTKYNGWQRQTNAPSVQQTIEEALGKILREKTEVTGAGRTDTGVHARYYVAHFDAASGVGDTASFLYHLNAVLPDDIAISGASPVGDDAHARFGAIEREYKYYISRAKDPFSAETAWHHHAPLDIAAMNLAAGALLRESDFTSFAKLHSDNKTNICKVSAAAWREQDGTTVFTIRADRFLRNMVRAIVGTLADVGRGKISPGDFHRILEARDLSLCSGSAPAKGLFLTDIKYPEEIFNPIKQQT